MPYAFLFVLFELINVHKQPDTCEVYKYGEKNMRHPAYKATSSLILVLLWIYSYLILSIPWSG